MVRVSCLVPGGCLLLARGDKNNPEGLEGGRDSPRHEVGPRKQVQILKGGLGHHQATRGLTSAWFSLLQAAAPMLHFQAWGEKVP